MKRVLSLLCALVVVAVGEGVQAREACAFDSPPTVLFGQGDPHAKGGRLLQVWEVPDRRVWWSKVPPAGYADFRARVARHVPQHDPRRLLTEASGANNAVVLAAPRGWIRPANCLEMLLQQTQDRRIDTFVAPTEFVGFILRSPEGRRLRVYFYTVNDDGIGRAAPVTDPVKRDRAAGWTVLAGLHNHNFHPGQPELNGPLGPSGPDAQFNANFAEAAGMREAWITNGIDSVHIPASAFGRFHWDGR